MIACGNFRPPMTVSNQIYAQTINFLKKSILSEIITGLKTDIFA